MKDPAKVNLDEKSRQNDPKYIKKKITQFAKVNPDIRPKPNLEIMQKAHKKEVLRNKLAGMKAKKLKDIEQESDGKKPEVIIDHKNRKYVKAPTTGKLHRIKRLSKGERKHRKQTVGFNLFTLETSPKSFKNKKMETKNREIET